MDNSKQIIALYDDYNTIIKPLIAEVEARTEQFPLPLFNEIRALHDHIARCYFKDITPEQRNIEIHKAERHVLRIILDCYKCLNLSIHDSVLLFEKQTRHVDLTVLQNGTFYPKYKSLRSDAVRAVRKAKILESINTSEALDFYQQHLKAIVRLVKHVLLLMDTTAPDVHWARVHFTVRRALQVLLWILSAVASGIISIVLADLF